MIDVGAVRGAGTAVLLLCFVVLCAWAWSPSQKRRFEEASRLPFLGDREDGADARRVEVQG